MVHRVSSWVRAGVFGIGVVAGCAPSGVWVGRDGSARDAPARDAAGALADDLDARVEVRSTPPCGSNDDAATMRDASLPATDFVLEPSADAIDVAANGRAELALRLARAEGHLAFVELGVSGLPRGVAGRFAVGPAPDALLLVIEASDLAVVGETPFTIEGVAEGLRRTRRVLLRVTPEVTSAEE